MTFGFTPDVLMDLWMERLCAHGVRSWWIYDVLFNIDKMARLARLAKKNDCEVAATMLFTLSPVHDDAFWADKADKLSALPEVDSLLLYDTGGVLDRDRIKTLVPALVANARGKPIEMHSNNMLGQSAKAYCDAVEFGVSVLHTASRSMSNGPSIPSIDIMVKNMEALGHTHDIDTALLKPVSDHFERVGKTAGYLVNQHYEYDVSALTSQVPGGMMGTLRNQLVQQNMLEKLPGVLDEVARVRRELGYPGMATPFAQLVGTVAVLNIVTGRRWGTVPDEVIQYAVGYYGEPPAPIDAEVMDRIMASPRARDIADNPPLQPSLDDLRRQHGTGENDDELILRALVPASDIERMRRSGPAAARLSDAVLARARSGAAADGGDEDALCPPPQRGVRSDAAAVTGGCRVIVPRRRPGPRWETIVRSRGASSPTPSQLGLGLRRGTSKIAGVTTCG